MSSGVGAVDRRIPTIAIYIYKNNKKCKSKEQKQKKKAKNKKIASGYAERLFLVSPLPAVVLKLFERY